MADTADDSIELVLRGRFQPRIPIKTKLGYQKLGAVKATTVHQKFSGAKTRIPAELATCEHICDST
jgi:hypothetical protein